MDVRVDGLACAKHRESVYKERGRDNPRKGAARRKESIN